MSLFVYREKPHYCAFYERKVDEGEEVFHEANESRLLFILFYSLHNKANLLEPNLTQNLHNTTHNSTASSTVANSRDCSSERLIILLVERKLRRESRSDWRSETNKHLMKIETKLFRFHYYYAKKRREEKERSKIQRKNKLYTLLNYCKQRKVFWSQSRDNKGKKRML